MNWSWDEATLSALETYLRNAGLHGGAPDPRPIGDGHSNLTYLIRVRGGQAVLRRPPPPPLPRGANDVLREAQVLRALQDSPVPTPRILAVAEAGTVLDVPFYVMEHVPGPVVSTAMPAPFQPERDAPAMAFELVDALARLHAVDWRACGLEKFGRPENFNARHLSRLRALMEQREGAVPGFLADMAAALEADIPAESGAAIVHLDFRLGNVIWTPEAPPKLLAVLDWELATIGDPLLDLGYLICCHPQPGEVLTATQELSTALLAPGAPGRASLAARYGAVTGHDVTRLGWYAAMAAWKLAVMFDYQHRLARDPFYADATQAPRFIAQAEHFLSVPVI